jgi:hypothetical protein
LHHLAGENVAPRGERRQDADGVRVAASVGMQLSQLMSLTTGGDRPASRAQESMLAILAIGAALVLASIWGIAAGSESAQLAVANAYKVPMVIFLSALTALPAGLVTLRLTNARLSAVELASAFATSIFGGTLVLATLAPLVAIYYHTSSKAGLPLALGSVFVALATASLLFARAVARRVEEKKSLLAVVVLVGLFLAALLQFVALAAPIIGTHGTVFDGGFDRVF